MRVGAFAAARHVPETPSYKPIVAALMPHTFAEVRVGCRQTVVRGRVDPSTARYLCACSTLGWARAHVSPDTRACWMLHRLCCGRLGLPLRSPRAWSRLDRSRPSLAPVEIVIAVELVVVAVPVEPVVAFAAVEGVVASPTLDDVVALAAESLVRARLRPPHRHARAGVRGWRVRPGGRLPRPQRPGVHPGRRSLDPRDSSPVRPAA